MGLAAALQYRSGRTEAIGGRLTLGNKSRAGVSLKYKSKHHWWVGGLAMLMPLCTLLLQSIGLLR